MIRELIEAKIPACTMSGEFFGFPIIEKIEDVKIAIMDVNIRGLMPHDYWIRVTYVIDWVNEKLIPIYSEKIGRRLGIRCIPVNKLKLPKDLAKAYDVAKEALQSDEKFIGHIELYWPLTPECKAPFYVFHTDQHRVIRVDAFSFMLLIEPAKG